MDTPDRSRYRSRHFVVGVPAALAPSSALADGLATAGDPAVLGGVAVAAAFAGAAAAVALLRRGRRKAAAPGGESRRLLDVLARIQGRYIERRDEPAGLEALLQDVLAMSDSPFGVLVTGDGTDGLAERRRRVAAWRDGVPGGETPPDVEQPLAKAFRKKKPVVTRETAMGNAAVCAVPLVVGGDRVGGLVLVGRPGGYLEADLAHWAPVFRATAHILDALAHREARDAARDAVARSSDQQRLILENMADGVLILDGNLKVRRINKAVRTLFGYDDKDLVGTDGAGLFEPGERTRRDGFSGLAFLTGVSRFFAAGAETTAVHRSGRRFPVELTVTAIAGDDGPSYVATIHDITRQKRDADALARSEREYRSVLDNMHDTFYRTDLEGRLVMVARSVADLLGYAPEELLGTRLADTYRRPGDRDVFLDALRANNGHVTDFVAPLVHKDGHTVWVSTNARYWRDADGNVTGVEGTTRDITGRLEAERKFRAIADYTFEWESWVGPDGDVIWVSPGVERVTGYTADECLAMSGYPRALVHPDERDAFARALAQPEGDAREFRFVAKDGTEVWGAMSWQAIADASGNALGVRTSVRDITDAKRVETHFVQQAKLATLGETAAGLVHELSQPLNIIRLAAEGTLLKMDGGAVGDTELHHQFSLIEGQARRMGEIIDHIRVFSRKDQDAADYFNPLDAVAASVDLLADQLRTDDIDVVRDLPDAPCAVNGRQVQLEQVVLNLLTNARDAIIERRDSRPDESRPSRITVTGRLDEGASVLHLSVADTGGGFPPDQIDRVFEPFFTTKDVGIGTGLGLSVSFGIISGLNGRIDAVNTEDGARIDIELPCERETGAPVQPARRGGGTLTAAGERHALVIDDEQEAAFAIATFVEGLGFRVSIGHDGEEAREIYAADPADVLITDIRMPRCDGHELIRALRTEAPDLPVIVITGHFGNGRDADELRRANPDRVLRKPVSLEKLRDALHDLLRRD